LLILRAVKTSQISDRNKYHPGGEEPAGSVNSDRT
jgi:hypothetical protein